LCAAVEMRRGPHAGGESEARIFMYRPWRCLPTGRGHRRHAAGNQMDREPLDRGRR
jgi:hypothetical protein